MTTSSVEFKKLSEEETLYLEKPFSENEVKDLVWACDNDVNPGPDGISLFFFENCWDILKVGVLNFVNIFHVKASLPKGVRTAFLALIPKHNNSQSLEDFRPIFLIGSLYNILSKELETRLL